MSSFKNASKATQRTHRERHQPEARQHLGLLEKKKDYKTRSKNYNQKKQTLKLLRKRALNRNPDEFYFHMINSKVENGIHKEKPKVKEHTNEQLKLMETQDLNYVAYRRNIEAKKIEKLQSRLHMIDTANETQNSHIFFVDDDKEAKDFDVASKLDTHPALLDRKTNRPKLSRLKTMKLPDLSKSDLQKIEREKRRAYVELHKRINRERELTVVQQKLEMKQALKDKKITKPKQIRDGSKDAAPIYKWKFQRKR